ncbi:hypothetical protein ACRS5A_18765 [Acinetobacter baumannii]|uniref:hypothetical protein n=1 Tax=Acinetobacter baumannii TaxID=470 RepID=UPI003B36F579
MNTYFGHYPATIVSVDRENRTAKVKVSPITDGLDSGITATFQYAIGENDFDTEVEILEGADVYVFFLQGDPYSPVICGYRSHGKDAEVGHRRIRQENIELIAQHNISLIADEILLEAKTVKIKAEKIINEGDSETTGTQTVRGKSTLEGGANIDGIEFDTHKHGNSPGPS